MRMQHNYQVVYKIVQLLKQKTQYRSNLFKWKKKVIIINIHHMASNWNQMMDSICISIWYRGRGITVNINESRANCVMLKVLDETLDCRPKRRTWNHSCGWKLAKKSIYHYYNIFKFLRIDQKVFSKINSGKKCQPIHGPYMYYYLRKQKEIYMLVTADKQLGGIFPISEFKERTKNP